MSEIIVDPASARCSSLLSEAIVVEHQSVDPDRPASRARDARGRFAAGHSGNPNGRPRGIPNPKRSLPDLGARPASAAALSNLVDRKPHLLRLLAAQLLPPPLTAPDPAERLGIDPSSLRTAEDAQRVLSILVAALGRGRLAPGEAARIARRVRARLRILRRLARAQRRLARDMARLRRRAGRV